jgi:hypothetical protein
VAIGDKATRDQDRLNRTVASAGALATVLGFGIEWFSPPAIEAIEEEGCA